jgi:hypothetical protein
MAAADPFTFIIETLWDVLEGNSSFLSLVSANNRIKLEGFRPFKNPIMESSVPEVNILPAGKRLFEENDCSGCSIIQTTHITVATGLEATAKAFAVQWAITQAIYDGLNGSSLIYDLEWEDETIIKSVNTLPWEEGLSYDDLNRSIKGWAAILPLEVKIRASRTLLGV